MAHYIDIEKAEEDFFNFRCNGCECYPDGCVNCLIHEGAKFFIDYDESDVRPVVHGYWEKYNTGSICSICRWHTLHHVDYADAVLKYCPNCGAKMDLEPTVG